MIAETTTTSSSQFSRMCGGLSCLLGLIVLLGWHTHSPLLIQLLPQLPVMQYNTALGFFLSGLGLLCIDRAPKFSFLIGALVTLLGGATFIEYTFELNLGIDELFIEQYIPLHTSHSGSMAPNATLCFSLAGLALMLSTAQKAFVQKITFIIALFLCTLGMLAVLGCLFRIPTGYGWGNLTQMALHTAIGFIVLGTGEGARAYCAFSSIKLRESIVLPTSVLAVGMFLFLLLWHSMNIFQFESIKQGVEREAKQIASEAENAFGADLYAIDRLFQRSRIGYPKENIWRESINSYLENIPSIKVVASKKGDAGEIDIISSFPIEEAALLVNKCSNTETFGLINSEEGSYLCLYDDHRDNLALIEFKTFLGNVLENSHENVHVRLNREDGSSVYQLQNHLDVERPFDSPLLTSSPLFLSGKQFQLQLTPTALYLEKHRQPLLKVVLLSGLITTFLLSLSILIWQVSARKNSLLFLANERNRLLLESADEGIYGVDLDGNATFVNEAASTMLGYDTKELLGSLMHEKVHHAHSSGENHPVETCHMCKFLQDGRMHRIENEVLWRKDGSSFWVAYSATPFKEKGEIAGAVVMFSDISLRKEQEDKLESIAYKDTLTGLSNRLEFEEKIQQSIDDTNEAAIAIFYIGIDRFKTVNDSLGYAAGDALLQFVGERITSLRMNLESIARLGGDEFGIIHRTEHKGESKKVAEKIIEALRAPFYIGEKKISITSSIGAAYYSDEKKPEELVKKAAIALHYAKSKAKDTFEYFDEALENVAKRRLALEQNLMQSILTKKGFHLLYQPIYSLKNQKETLSSFEVLLRWEAPTLGVVPPDEFIPMAEEMFLMDNLGQWILKTSLERFSEWYKQDPSLQISINLSPQELYNENFLPFLASQLSRHKIPCSALIFEVTETSLIQDIDFIGDRLRQLSGIGCQIVIDDFGMGYSSLNLITQFPVSGLKIDKSFIAALEEDDSEGQMVKTIISIAKLHNFVTVAEGIETKAQLEFVRTLGAHKAQGYYLSRPLKFEDIQIK